jgi:hypothetical protein
VGEAVPCFGSAPRWSCARVLLELTANHGLGEDALADLEDDRDVTYSPKATRSAQPVAQGVTFADITVGDLADDEEAACPTM